MNSVRNEIDKIKDITIKKVSPILVSKGEEFNKEISLDKLIRKYPSESIFKLAITESLVWSYHAKRKKSYDEVVLKWLKKGEDESVNKYVWRYGLEALQNVLVSWYNILQELGDLKNNFNCKELKEFQRKVIDISVSLYNKNKLYHFGSWILCSPFKILVGHRKDLWKDSDIDEIYMPLGLQVIRGLQYLSRRSLSMDKSIFTLDENIGLSDGMSIVIMAQNFQKKIARYCNSKVIHINSGLFCLGKFDDNE